MKRLTAKNVCISWSAIFSGAVAGVGANFLLNLLSLGLAISCFSVGLSGKTVFSLAGSCCFGLSAIISMFLTGWLAGKLTPHWPNARIWGALYGFLAWSILLMMTIILITNMIQYSAFHANFTSNLVAIKITNDAPMLTETVADSINNSPFSINMEMKEKVIILNAFLTFLLFFIGGMASCFGGYLGYQPSTKYNSLDEQQE